jgi:hypothetical protein
MFGEGIVGDGVVGTSAVDRWLTFQEAPSEST